MTVQSDAGIFYEAYELWYFGDEGIKRSKSFERWDPDGITDLSAKTKLRWSKVCEWLDNYFRRNPARRKAQSKSRNLESLLRELEIDMESTIAANVSNFPGDLLDGPTTLTPWFFCFIHTGFLLILVVLSLVYGGIHLATLNFSFASKTEHLLWKIACIDIMATVPVGVLCILVLASFDSDSDRRFLSYRTYEILETLSTLLADIGCYALLVFYVLSRLYIVVEAFIGLRHVPIGVYAAVPWVQAIPHV